MQVQMKLPSRQKDTSTEEGKVCARVTGAYDEISCASFEIADSARSNFEWKRKLLDKNFNIEKQNQRIADSYKAYAFQENTECPLRHSSHSPFFTLFPTCSSNMLPLNHCIWPLFQR